MEITKVEYDAKKGVVRVELELPVVGELSKKEAKDYLKELVLHVFPEETFEGKVSD